jgi:hypothetical protein
MPFLTSQKYENSIETIIWRYGINSEVVFCELIIRFFIFKIEKIDVNLQP